MGQSLLQSVFFPLAVFHALLLLIPASTRTTIAFSKPRVFVLTDIANEPDDAMSLVRFLLYSNQFEVAGICATTSVWLNNETHIEQIFSGIDAYADIYDNLSAHQPDSEGPWPTAEELISKTYSGRPLYGLSAVGAGQSSNGSDALMQAVDQHEDATWVLMWGGANVLAQAVWEYEQNHTEKEIAQFVSKLRVYSISDQDDSGSWLRLRHPQIFWIVSLHAMNVYNDATWTGISGETLYAFDLGGPDGSLVTNEWLQTNVRDVSSFGQAYPDFEFIMEGDTPSFLYMIQNGLGVPEHPYWGSWGGRYGRFTNLTNLYVNTIDAEVLGMNGANFTSPHATVWRWRDAYQWDFSGRMRWTSTSNFSAVNHNPVVVLNGSNIVAEPLYLNVTPGQIVVLDASASYDPDHNQTTQADTSSDKGFANVTYWQYLDASTSQRVLESSPALNITQNDLTAIIQVPDEEAIPSAWIAGMGANFEDRTLHLIVEIWDDGTPSLVGYKRVVFNVAV